MGFDFEVTEDIRRILNKCQNPPKAGEVLLWLVDRCRAEGLPFTDYQWKSLANHVAAMVNRSVTGDVLDIDPELFDDVNEDSLALSQQVVERIGGIADEEKFLLSIHFESAKENIV